MGNKESEERTDLAYTVTSEDRLPEELKLLVEGKKQQPFKTDLFGFFDRVLFRAANRIKNRGAH